MSRRPCKQFTLRIVHRITRLERRRPAGRTCPGCGDDGAYRVEFRSDRSPPRSPRPACGDRSLIIVEFIETPMPPATRTHSPRYFEFKAVQGLVEELVRVTGTAAAPDDRFRAVADELTGSLIVAAPATHHEQINSPIERLDSQPVDGRRPMRTLRVRSRSVTEVLAVLHRLVSFEGFAETVETSSSSSAWADRNISKTAQQSAYDVRLPRGTRRSESDSVVEDCMRNGSALYLGTVLLALVFGGVHQSTVLAQPSSLSPPAKEETTNRRDLSASLQLTLVGAIQTSDVFVPDPDPGAAAGAEVKKTSRWVKWTLKIDPADAASVRYAELTLRNDEQGALKAVQLRGARGGVHQFRCDWKNGCPAFELVPALPAADQEIESTESFSAKARECVSKLGAVYRLALFHDASYVEIPLRPVSSFGFKKISSSATEVTIPMQAIGMIVCDEAGLRSQMKDRIANALKRSETFEKQLPPLLARAKEVGKTLVKCESCKERTTIDGSMEDYLCPCRGTRKVPKRDKALDQKIADLRTQMYYLTRRHEALVLVQKAMDGKGVVPPVKPDAKPTATEPEGQDPVPAPDK